MPELPEVETVKRGLESLLNFPAKISSVRSSSKSLRFRYPRGLKKRLPGSEIYGIERRAKYLIFDLGENSMICHLGMTGNWRQDHQFHPSAHDHFFLGLEDGTNLVYNDVRRFGYIDLLPTESLSKSRWFEKLGPEPFRKQGLTEEWLREKFGDRKASVKSLIMNQEVVVGVGNIYASEALFMSGILPETPAGSLSRNQVSDLVKSIEKVIQSAIKSGGTTIKDFKNAGGSGGYFQTKLSVYGRAGELCHACHHPIKTAVVAGRSTYWCDVCQK